MTRIGLFFQGILLFFCASLLSRPGFCEETISADHVRISWLAPENFAHGTETIALSYEVEAGWHIYWKNPGDSGTAPKFHFTAEGATVGPILWPYPERMKVGDLTNLGYNGRASFPFTLTLPKEGDKVRLTAQLEWLVCQEECLPGFGELTLERLRGEGSWNPDTLAARDAALSRVPQGQAKDVGWRAKVEGDLIRVSLQIPDSAEAPDLFPVNGEFLNAAAPLVEKTASGYDFLFSRAVGATAKTTTDFVLVQNGKAWDLPARSRLLTTEPNESFWLLILSAFLGGILLNLMPCVLPVLSIKFFSLARTEVHARHKEGLLYTLGVLSSFLVLGGIALGLRATGAAVGWGFQLQSPLIVFSLILLFWMMALNFLGVFEMGFFLMNAAGRSRMNGAFATGVLSVFVAAPCTGPFMGTALGAAAVLPAVPALGIFLSMGFGLSFPLLIACYIPRLAKILPKPGPWMIVLKQFLAFPLFGTVVWLLWVLGEQKGTEAWLLASIGLLGLSCAFWIGRFPRVKILAYLLGLLSIAYALQRLHTLEKPAIAQTAPSQWKAFSEKLVDDARANNQPVFIDFTAAWCITCQVNKKAVLRTEAGLSLFAKNNVLLLEADWTDLDQSITDALARFGRNSVPLYVYYGPGAQDAQILPQILTLATIEDLFPTKETLP